MGEFFDKVKHVALKVANGAVKGAMWGAIAAGVMGVLAVAATAIPVIGWVAGPLGAAALWAMAPTIVGYAAAAGAALGGIDGLSTAGKISEENLSLQRRQLAQQNMLVTLQERQLAINNGMPQGSVITQNQLPSQQVSGAQRGLS